jgi:hypothetical protein
VDGTVSQGGVRSIADAADGRASKGRGFRPKASQQRAMLISIVARSPYLMVLDTITRFRALQAASGRRWRLFRAKDVLE